MTKPNKPDLAGAVSKGEGAGNVFGNPLKRLAEIDDATWPPIGLSLRLCRRQIGQGRAAGEGGPQLRAVEFLLRP